MQGHQRGRRSSRRRVPGRGGQRDTAGSARRYDVTTEAVEVAGYRPSVKSVVPAIGLSNAVRNCIRIRNVRPRSDGWRHFEPDHAVRRRQPPLPGATFAMVEMRVVRYAASSCYTTTSGERPKLKHVIMVPHCGAHPRPATRRRFYRKRQPRCRMPLAAAGRPSRAASDQLGYPHGSPRVPRDFGHRRWWPTALPLRRCARLKPPRKGRS